jgi:putative heme degradation protein
VAPRRFPPPWSVEETDPKLNRRCFIIRDSNGQALAYIYFKGESGGRAAAKLLHPRRSPAHRRQHCHAAEAAGAVLTRLRRGSRYGHVS